MFLMISMVVFSLSMSISPGPVNFVTMASGLNNGFSRSIRFVNGATLGFIALLVCIGMGLVEADKNVPDIINLLRYVGCAYLFYIGWRVFNDKGTLELGDRRQGVPSFAQGFLMQWLNPKAWVACLAGCSAFSVTETDNRLLLFSSIYCVICFLGIASWALIGDKIQVWIKSDTHLIIFNRMMGVTLCALAVVLLLN